MINQSPPRHLFRGSGHEATETAPEVYPFDTSTGDRSNDSLCEGTLTFKEGHWDLELSFIQLA